MQGRILAVVISVAVAGVAVGHRLNAAAHRNASDAFPASRQDGRPGGPRTPVIVELFTSEGCSSCPPADDLLAELVAKQPVPGAIVIGLEEHVDFWDRLGWTDPFSNVQFTSRQNAYTASAYTGSTYTPQMIVDGGSAFVGSDRADAMDAIAAAAKTSKRSMRLAWTAGAASAIDVAVSGVVRDADVMLAIVEGGLSTDVKRGENAGSRLTHSAVTRVLTRVGATDQNGGCSMSVPIAVAPTWRREHLTIIAFVQLRGPGRIVSIATLAPR
jgi:hypothetical protein